tara:strand:- start:38 stop:775 length:738 start_codon:yes stop_codon:yes gene_type:complete
MPFLQRKFTPAWRKQQWVDWATNKWPNQPVSKFKQMKTKQLIAIYHNCDKIKETKLMQNTKEVTLNKEIDLEVLLKDLGVYERYYDTEHKFVLDSDTKAKLLPKYKKTLSHLTNLWCDSSPTGYTCNTCQEYVNILLPIFELVRLRSSRGDNLADTDFTDIDNHKDSEDERSTLFYNRNDEDGILRRKIGRLEDDYKGVKDRLRDSNRLLIEASNRLEGQAKELEIEKAKNEQLVNIIKFKELSK